MCTKLRINFCSLAEIHLWGKERNKNKKGRGEGKKKIEHRTGKGEDRESGSSARERAGGRPGGLAERPAGAALFLSR